MIFHLVMGIQIVMKVVNQIKLPEPILNLADNLKVLVKLAVQANPKAKRVPEGSAPASAPVDPVAHMRSIIAAETEKCLNSMKELLTKQGLNEENSHNGSH